MAVALLAPLALFRSHVPLPALSMLKTKWFMTPLLAGTVTAAAEVPRMAYVIDVVSGFQVMDAMTAFVPSMISILPDPFRPAAAVAAHSSGNGTVGMSD